MEGDTIQDCLQEFVDENLLNTDALTHVNKAGKILPDADPKLISKCSVLLPKPEIYECNQCTRGFLSHRERQIHFIKHAEEKVKQMNQAEEDPKYIKKYKCELCDYMFVEASTLKLHAIVHKPSKFTCHCGIKFRLGEDYLMHKKIIHSETITETEQHLLQKQEHVKKKRKSSIIPEILPTKKIKRDKPVTQKCNKLPQGKKKRCKKCNKMYTHTFHSLHSCKINNHVETQSGATINKISKSRNKIIKKKSKTKEKTTENKLKTQGKVVENKSKTDNKNNSLNQMEEKKLNVYPKLIKTPKNPVRKRNKKNIQRLNVKFVAKFLKV